LYHHIGAEHKEQQQQEKDVNDGSQKKGDPGKSD
jgi:hypothetical protein